MTPSSAAARLLLVEDHPETVTLVRSAIRDSVLDCALVHVETVEAARDALAEDAFACILANVDGAAGPDLALLDELLRDPHGAPVVCLTAATTPTLDLLRRGAFDCVVAGEDSAVGIVRAVRHAVELHVARRRYEESELRATALRDLAPVGHFELDADLTPIFVTEICHQLCGLVENDPASFKRTLVAVHREDLAAVYAAVEDFKAGRMVHLEYRRLCPDGEVLVLDMRASAVVDADGRVISYVGRVVNVTEHRRVEQRERASRAQLQAIFDHSPSVMWFKDPNSRYVFVNRVFAEFFDREPEEFHGLGDADLFPADFATLLRERDLMVLEGDGPMEFEDEIDSPTGPRQCSSVLFAIFDSDGEAMGLCGLSTDVTERRETDERFRRSFDDAPVAMAMARPDGTLLRVNRALADLLGYEQSELLDRPFAAFTHPDDLDEDLRRGRELIEGGGPWTHEKRFIRRDGTVIWVLSCVDIARDSAGRPMWFVAHLLDITQRKHTEHELQRQQMDMLTIARVARDTGSSERPGQQVCQAAAQITGASSVAVLELRSPERLVLAAAMEEDAPLGLEITIETPPTGAALCAVSKERLFLGEARHSPPISQRFAQEANVHSVVFEPILRGSDVLGVLTIAWSQPRDALTPRESSVIRLLAAEMATIIERARLTAQLRELARTDPLTGLANRRVWDERIAVELSHAKRIGHPVCVALVDLDHFKRYNDSQGHQAGDRLLSGATAAWGTELRSGDLLARVGGDEFAVLLPDCDLEGGRALIERLRMSTPGGVGCSVGIVQWDGDEPADVAISRADAALYAAKESGRARSVAG